MRPVALGLLPILIGATWVHYGAGWVFSNENGGWEYPAFLVAVSVASALLGPGKFALKLPSFGNQAKTLEPKSLEPGAA